jgi:hypothetical protein
MGAHQRHKLAHESADVALFEDAIFTAWLTDFMKGAELRRPLLLEAL